MLGIGFIRENIEIVKKGLKDRRSDADLDGLLSLDEERRDMLNRIETLRHDRKEVSKKIGKLKRDKKDARKEMETAAEINRQLSTMEEDFKELEGRYDELLLTFPNIPHNSVPVGEDESKNRYEREWGEKPEFDFEPKAHDELAEHLGIIDFQRAGKVAGARFATYVGIGARLERALIDFMLDLQTKENSYLELLPPFIANSDALTGTGQLPKFEEDLFKLNHRDYYLIPTAEVPLTYHFAGEILSSDDLPVKLVAFTPCFRSEAGSYGKDVKGLIRQHQFNKVEIVKLVHPDSSWDELEKLTADAEMVLQRLGLHYRVVTLCTGDLGFSAARTYDLEVWLPGQAKYREISSCSNFTDFQARRSRIRFKDTEAGKNRYVHTLNGSALAVGRTVIAIMEQFQQEDGGVLVPEALRPYLDGLERITGI